MERVRHGNAWVAREHRVRRDGIWQVLVPGTLPTSSPVFPGPPWWFSMLAAQPVTTFPDGSNRNRLYATGSAAGWHSMGRTWSVTPGQVRRLRFLYQADTPVRLQPELYTPAYVWGGLIDPATGAPPGNGATVTGIASGVFRYDWDYSVPAGVSSIEVRLVLYRADGTGSYVAGGESVFVGAVSFDPL